MSLSDTLRGGPTTPVFRGNPAAAAAIEIVGLRKSFGTVEAVRGADLTVQWGEVFGLLGPNGAGKTTTLRMMTTLIRPDEGVLKIAGVDLRREARKARTRLGYVPQGSSTWDDCTARQELISQARMFRLPKREAVRRAHDMVERFELAEFADRRIRTCSGGQRRRVEIALGIIHQPRVLLLDEPTAGLDPQSRARLWDDIRALRAEGMTVVLTTHYLDEADTLCDRVAIMDNGVIVAQGSPDDLKLQIADDQVTIRVDDAARAMTVLAPLAEAKGIWRLPEQNVRLSTADGTRAIPTFVQALAREGIVPHAVEYARPSLDDVFLIHTGRRMRD